MLVALYFVVEQMCLVASVKNSSAEGLIGSVYVAVVAGVPTALLA